MFSQGQAAKAAGVSKSTISKALKSGKLSYVEKTSAGYKIDPAELFRVYPANGVGNGEVEPLETQGETAVNPTKTNALQKEVEVLREMIEELKSERDYARDQASEWKEQAAKVTALLEGTTTANRKGFWARVFG